MREIGLGCHDEIHMLSQPNQYDDLNFVGLVHQVDGMCFSALQLFGWAKIALPPSRRRTHGSDRFAPMADAPMHCARSQERTSYLDN
ncbi:protein of unknown function [Magnetospirillum sp. XM-1]|nr:protein of unknown function [Magnetospirillum sp. XM-1]